MVYKGPNIVKEIKKELISILKKKTLVTLKKLLELKLDQSNYNNYTAKGKFMSKDVN